MKAICWDCTDYARQEQIGDYTFRCTECGAENDKNDLHHSVIGPDVWCGVGSCPKCQGYAYGPDERPPEDKRKLDLNPNPSARYE